MLPQDTRPDPFCYPDHPSVPNNPLIAESLYLTRYIEKAGSGTQRMIELCRDAGLPAPDFELRGGSFVLTLWRDWLTNKVVEQLGLSTRQKTAAAIAKSTGRITNAVYQEATGVARTSAKRDLEELVAKGVLTRSGRGRGAGYSLAKNGPQMGQMVQPTEPENGP